MGETYFSLKRKLDELGYNNTLPIDAVPLVESIVADLLQTTRSLQHYMDLSKEALLQRDSLMLEAEPYKCDNAKLIQENNELNREVIHLKEENMKISKESKRKIKAITEELMKKDSTISKLQHDLRDLSLRGLCAETQSSRNRRRKEAGDTYSKLCVCNDTKFHNAEAEFTEMRRKISVLEEKNEECNDEIILLKTQIEHRDNEIIRLNMLLEGGRPLPAISKDCCNLNPDTRVQNLIKKLNELENANEILKKEISTGLEKQHEAMLRALGLADKNKALKDELQKVDTLALKVEEDCNKRLASMLNEINFLQTRLEGLVMKNSQLEKEVAKKVSKEMFSSPKDNDLLDGAIREKDALQREIRDLVELNKGLQDKILALSQLSKARSQANSEYEHSKDYKSCPTKYELQLLLENERKKYEKHIVEIQDKLSETISLFNQHIHKCKDKDSFRFNTSHGSSLFVKDLHNKLCEKEQRILMLQKENDDFKAKQYKNEEGNKQNYKDVISQLNAENAELSKENILLSQQLSQHRNINSAKYNETNEYRRRDVIKLKEKIEELTNETQLLKKDKHEYNSKYKEAMDMVEKLKRDLAYKHKDMELLQEENSSYKMSHRTGKASADHLKDECNFLKEQIKKMQSDVIKEKTLANQIKNIQLETERSTNEIQNELLCLQKKYSLSNDKIDSLERKCKELQSEIGSLQSDKSNLIDNIRKLDQERDKLVIELDHKAETISILEQKLKSQTYDIGKLEDEISDLKRRLNVSKVSEHKLVDNEAQIAFLNGEILRLTQQLDNAIMENKQLQNSLADVNGTMKLNRIEYEKSRKEVDGLKQQLQHYVAEIRRIEELLSSKEADRSDMLEQFASLSVEANILENTNHSLESESASKSLQLQSYVSKIQSLEEKLLDKDNIIDGQSARLASMACKVTALENEVKLLTEEKVILEQNISYLKQMCNNIQSEHTNMSKSMGETDSELKLYENKIKSLGNIRAKLEGEKDVLTDKLMTTENLLSSARREIVDLKLALQDATTETKSLQDRVSRLTTHHSNTEEREAALTRELDLPLMLEETIYEVSHEEDEGSSRYHEIHKTYSKYTHGSTL